MQSKPAFSDKTSQKVKSYPFWSKWKCSSRAFFSHKRWPIFLRNCKTVRLSKEILYWLSRPNKAAKQSKTLNLNRCSHRRALCRSTALLQSQKALQTISRKQSGRSWRGEVWILIRIRSRTMIACRLLRGKLGKLHSQTSRIWIIWMTGKKNDATRLLGNKKAMRLLLELNLWFRRFLSYSQALLRFLSLSLMQARIQFVVPPSHMRSKIVHCTQPLSFQIKIPAFRKWKGHRQKEQRTKGKDRAWPTKKFASLRQNSSASLIGTRQKSRRSPRESTSTVRKCTSGIGTANENRYSHQITLVTLFDQFWIVAI